MSIYNMLNLSLAEYIFAQANNKFLIKIGS